MRHVGVTVAMISTLAGVLAAACGSEPVGAGGDPATSCVGGGCKGG